MDRGPHGLIAPQAGAGVGAPPHEEDGTNFDFVEKVG